jgi:membrane-bound inhibitor of C-type lysozyme
LTFKDNEFLLNRQVSGSGVKYSADNVLFWSKGDEAMLILKGKKYQCSLIKQ